MARRTQQGMTLMMALVMTIAVLVIGFSAAELAWQGEKAARAQRDRHVAFQAAEAALDDAEKGIQAGATAPACTAASAKPAWQVVDLSGVEDGGACSATYGSATGAAMETGQGFLPFARPRYLVERLECHAPGEDAAAAPSTRYCYRVTVIGFGAQPATQVVLQSVYRPAD
jgi:type IV pilus assembly protein PilX